MSSSEVFRHASMVSRLNLPVPCEPGCSLCAAMMNEQRQREAKIRARAEGKPVDSKPYPRRRGRRR